MLRRSPAALFAAFLVIALAQPAEAKAPSTVKNVQIVKATTTSLTLTWPKVKTAKRYEVFFSTSYSKVSSGKKRKAGGASSYTVKGLKAGVTYCFAVRAVRGGSIGKRSQRTCKPTVRRGGVSSGLKVRVVTFNTCSRVCGGSAKRNAQGQALLKKASPDIIGLQEANDFKPPSGFRSAYYRSAKNLLYKTSVFDLALGKPTVLPCELENDDPDLEPALCTDPGEPQAGSITLNAGKYAVWAELVHKKTRRHLIAVSVHLTSGKGKSQAAARKLETKKLLTGVAKVSGKLPVIYAGDFNSHKNRGSLDTVGPTMKKAGYYDAFDLARNLKNPNWNSSLLNGRPKFGVKWGDHVDHIWVKSTNGVRAWSKLGTLSKPYASDHFPVRVDLTIR